MSRKHSCLPVDKGRRGSCYYDDIGLILLAILTLLAFITFVIGYLGIPK